MSAGPPKMFICQRKAISETPFVLRLKGARARIRKSVGQNDRQAAGATPKVHRARQNDRLQKGVRDRAGRYVRSVLRRNGCHVAGIVYDHPGIDRRVEVVSGRAGDMPRLKTMDTPQHRAPWRRARGVSLAVPDRPTSPPRFWTIEMLAHVRKSAGKDDCRILVELQSCCNEAAPLRKTVLRMGRLRGQKEGRNDSRS